MNRRAFFKMATGMAAFTGSLPSPASAGFPGGALMTRKRFLMGTVFEVLAYSDSPERAAGVMDEALAEVERLEKVLSSFDPESEVSRLRGRRCTGPCRLSPDLYRVIERSLEFSRLSGGRFDVTVSPLTRLWRQGREESVDPSEADLRKARPDVGYHNLALVPPDGLLARSGRIELDFGGIGKGYAADRAAEVLRSGGVTRSLINAGRSSILALDPPRNDSGWKIRLTDGHREIRLTNRAMSTSSQPVLSGIGDDNRREAHIFDPLTGLPAQFGVSVSIICSSATTADALSTACLLLGYERSCRMLAGIQHLVMFWIGPDGISKTFTTEL